MSPEQMQILRDALIGIRAHATMALAALGQMQQAQGGAAPRRMEAAPRGPQHYGDPDPEPAAAEMARRLDELGAMAPHPAPATRAADHPQEG